MGANGREWHSFAVEEVARLLQTDVDRGLKGVEVPELQKKFGPNELKGQKGVNPWKVLLGQFTNGLTVILVLAAVVSYAVQDYAEGGVLAFVIIFNAAVGFVQEYRAEKTMDALRRMASPTAKVIRDGGLDRISSPGVVPGDIIVLEVGDVVPADCRLIEVLNLEVDEAMLTGESLPVAKSVEPIKEDQASLGDRLNMVYSSTTLTKGRARGIAVATGMKTEIGKITKSISETASNSTPMQRRLNQMAYVLFGISLLLAVIVFAVNKFKFKTTIILYAVSLSIAVIPEGLIAVITIVMALGVRRMATQRALVRKLVALESLQAVTNICSDKTGTLTQGKMTVTSIWLSGKDQLSVSGDGWNTTGHIYLRDQVLDNSDLLSDIRFRLLVECSALCNTANIVEASEGKVWGDPTEIALQVFAYKFQMGKPTFKKTKEQLTEFPFSSDVKRMSMLCRDVGRDEFEIYTKGAENVLRVCDRVIENGSEVEIVSKEDFMQTVEAQIQIMAKQGLRVLVVAYGKETESGMGKPVMKWAREDVERSLVFLGLLGIRDTPRPESKRAVDQCYQAGIIVHMLTGDHPDTALAIAKEVGIIRPPPNRAEESVVPLFNPVMTAQEFDALSEEEIDDLAELPLVIARCTPATKVRMIEALHRRKKFAAMTGDGVNDAPSLKKADVGIAMGAGSDVAKQSSEIVLTDNNFATIVMAVSEGRRIFSNIRKFVLHLISTNVGEVIVLIIGLAFKDRSGLSVFPLAPVQILYMNMLTSTPPAMALGVEAASKEVMNLPPHTKGLFGKELLADMMAYGIIMGGLILTDWVLVIYAFGDGNLGLECNSAENLAECNTVFRARSTILIAFTWMMLLHAYNCRHVRFSLFTKDGGGASKIFSNRLLVVSVFVGAMLPIPPVYIPTLNTEIFKQETISWEWGIVIVSVVAFFICSEVYKFCKRKIMTSHPI
uniref:P-type Na(+) transporter n=1 Tax=Riccia fluitans TaxID=41844 RepID=D6CI00_9MARC|nr:Na+/K+ P-type ATPase [Riccia fluitans]